MKIVINKCYGGFGISDAAQKYMLASSYKPADPEYWDHSVDRSDPLLVAAVEALGSEAASGEYAKLTVVEVPDDVDWEIEEYDGIEWVSESHRTWH